MRISRHGARQILFTVLILAATIYSGIVLLIILATLILMFVLYFFRDPEREVVKDENVLLSPADGTFDEISEMEHDPYLGDGKFTKLGIFLALYNVHVNRAPADGVVEKIEYKKGKFVTAMNKDSSHLNECNNVVIRMKDNTRFLLRQIAGVAARRIIFEKDVNETVEQGDRLGMIKFGSRTEIILPTSKIKDILVKQGEKVTGAISRLATLKK